MRTISLDVKIVNVFLYTAIWVRLNYTHAFGHWVIFSGNKVTDAYRLWSLTLTIHDTVQQKPNTSKVQSITDVKLTWRDAGEITEMPV